MGRFSSASDAPIPYSDLHPERCRPRPGPEFVLPGEDAPRACGTDPAMPPVQPHWRRRVRRGFEELKS